MSFFARSFIAEFDAIGVAKEPREEVQIPDPVKPQVPRIQAIHPRLRFDVSVQDAVVMQKAKTMKALHVPCAQVLST